MFDPTEINAIRLKFFTSPQAYPSGVSAGQTIPQWELWSYLGLVSLPCLARGVFSLLKCDNEEAKVSLLRTWATPVFWTSPYLSLPQLPVASADFNPRVTSSDFIAPNKFSSVFPFSMSLFRILVISSTKFLKSYLKSPLSKDPAISSLFFP